MRARRVVTRWFSAKPATRIGIPVAVVALAVAGLFGGLERASLADRVDEVKPGAEVTLQPFKLTIKRAVAVDQIGDAIRPRTPGNRLMVLQADAENLSDASLGSYLLSPVAPAKSFMSRNLVVLDDQLAPETPTVYDADSNVAVSMLSPGLTYHLAIVWEFSGPIPRQLRLGLAELTWRADSISPDEFGWQDPEEAATLTLPVANATGDPT